MKGRTVILDRLGDRLSAALIEDGQLTDLLIAPPDDVPLPGAIYRAVIDRPMKGQGGAILKLPDGRGYLKTAKGLTPGKALVVQVTGFASDGKATPVTDRVLFKSRYAIATPGKPGINVSRAIRDDDRREALLLIAHEVVDDSQTGLILRSAAATASDEAVAEDILAMTELAASVGADTGDAPELLVDGPDPHTLAWREWPEPDTISTKDGGFADHGVDAMIAALRRPDVALGTSGRMFVEPTRALVAVDVNTGADTSLAAGLKANIAAARALPGQLRCRGLGGQVTLDLAPMPKKDRRQFESVLRAAFKSDASETVLAGWTPLGLYEMQRRRDRLPLT